MQLNNGMKFGRFKDGREKKTSQKTLFRQSKVWQEFRAGMIYLQNNRCECCGMVYPGAKSRQLQVHHLFPEKYELLNPANFSVVCSSCHDLIERFVTRIKGAAFNPPDNFSLWMQLLLRHLSQEARQKAEDILAGRYTIPEKHKMGKSPKRKPK